MRAAVRDPIAHGAATRVGNAKRFLPTIVTHDEGGNYPSTRRWCQCEGNRFAARRRGAGGMGESRVLRREELRWTTNSDSSDACGLGFARATPAVLARGDVPETIEREALFTTIERLALAAGDAGSQRCRESTGLLSDLSSGNRRNNASPPIQGDKATICLLSAEGKDRIALPTRPIRVAISRLPSPPDVRSRRAPLRKCVPRCFDRLSNIRAPGGGRGNPCSPRRPDPHAGRCPA